MTSRLALAACIGFVAVIGVRSLPAAVAKPGLPVAFEPNRGQTGKEFDFVAKGSGYVVELTGTRAKITLGRASGASPETVVLNLKGAKQRSEGRPLDQLKSINSYFVGNTSITGIPTFAKVRYDGVWPGVDVIYYGNGQQVECDFVVAAHANPHVIRMEFGGVRSMLKSPDGDLMLKTATGELVETKPVAYQFNGTERVPVAAAYKIGRGTVEIELGSYDPSKDLIIDPITRFLFSQTGNSISGQFALDAAAVATSGTSTLVTGFTPPFIPCQGCTTPYAGAFVSQFDATGDLVHQATISASDGNVYGLAVTTDVTGNVYLSGYTDSAVGLVLGPQGAFYQNVSGGGQDAFLTKIAPNLTAILFSTYIGGSGTDKGTVGALAANNNIAYVVGFTTSTNFPVVSPPAGQNGFIIALDTTKTGAASKVYALALGGSGTDTGLAAAADSSSNVYVGGSTTSTDFQPAIGPASFINTKSTTANDGFLLKLNAAGTLVWGTFFPGGVVNAVAISGAKAYVDGITTGSIQTTSTGYQLSGMNGNANHAFFAKLDTAQSGTNALLYSTYLSGSAVEIATSIAVGSDQKAYLAGATSSANFPTAGTPPPVQPSFVGGSIGQDGFFSILNPSAVGSAGLVYSTFLGLNGNTAATGITLDGYNQASVSATTYNSSNQPAIGSLFKYGTTFGPAPASVTDDINGDGTQDLVVYNPANGGFEYSLLSAGNGSYTSVGTFVGDINPGGVTFDKILQADFNGDLKSDILFYSTATGTLKVGLANLNAGPNTPGTGLYTYAPVTTITSGYTIIGQADFNNDGRTDLVLYRASDGAAAVGLSTGNGTFNYIGQTFSPGFTSVVVGDFNGDGNSDLIVYNNATSPYVAYLLLGDGTGHFVNSGSLFFGGGFTLIPADLNVDGKTDLVLYRPSDGTVFIALSNGSGFSYHYQLFSSNFTTFKIGDVNGDGNPDFVLYNSANAIGYLLLGDGAGNFTFSNSLFFGPGMDYVELRDVNGDGKQDVILYRTADGTNYTGISNLSSLAFGYTYNYFGPGRSLAK